MNANFVVIYCIRNNMVVIGDIIQNTKINENTEVRDIDDIVQYQTRLALEQIKGDMEFDTSLLDDEELEMFNKAIGAEEKGFAHGN
jgi:metallophosphoesterase superfamily enzyme